MTFVMRNMGMSNENTAQIVALMLQQGLDQSITFKESVYGS